MGVREFDLGEALAGAVRNALPALRGKPLGCSFDSRLPASRVLGDPVDLQCCLHRLMMGTVDLIERGFLVLDAEGRLRHGRLSARVMIAGSGHHVGDHELNGVLKRLALEPQPQDPGMRLRRAHGRCARTGAELEFVSLKGEGVLFKLHHTLQLAPGEAPPNRPDAGHARAWVIGADAAGTQVLSRRLQRLGWATWRFDSFDEAQARLHSMPRAQARPALVVALASSEADAARLQQLAASLPAATRSVLAVAPGARLLSDAQRWSPLELHVQPFSEADLQQLTAQIADGDWAFSGQTQPAPLLLSHRPRMLVVDDDEVNRLVGVGLAQTLGFEASAVADGAQAVAACLEAAPDLVLMDVCMPVLDGPDATRQLRQFQREGRTPPFPILGATADVTAPTRERCFAAGMDGVLTKPLLRDTLRAECQRLVVNCDHA